MLLNDERRRFSKKRKRTRRVLTLKCDNCEQIFEYSTTNVARKANSRSHFCSMDCNLVDQNRNKIKSHEETCLARYGVRAPMMSEEVRKKSVKTCMEKYGVSNTGAAKEFIEKREQTCMNVYGCKSVLSLDRIREKASSLETMQKRRQTSLDRYGVEWPMQNSVFQTKRHETMKQRRSYGTSRSEEQFYEFLLLLFDEKEIERQVAINGWNIDFYIKQTDTYVQFDGVYWHGLDRSIEEIRLYKKPRDVVIEQTWKRDREQNQWFKQHGMNLSRITDKEFLTLTNTL